MKRTPIEPNSTATERLLAAERDRPPMPAALRARVTERARGAFDTNRLAVRGSWSSRRTWLLVAAAVTVAAASFAALNELGSKADVRAPASPSAAAPIRPVASADATAAAVEAAPEQPAVTAESAPVAQNGRELTPRRSSSADAHVLELAILQRARAAVANAQFSTALAALAEHQRRFPSGLLQEEREALRVKALAGVGKTDEARKAARRFREKFPESVLSPRLEEEVRKSP